MPGQPTDVVLDGAGYMLAPAGAASRGADGYTRTQDGMSEGRTGRIRQTDFFGGQHRAYQLERDRAWDSIGVGPVHGGQAVEPWPYFTDVALDPGTPPVSAAGVRPPVPTALVGNSVYFAVGRYVYRTPQLGQANWATPVPIYDTGATGRNVTGMTYYNDLLLICAGNTSQDVAVVPVPNGTTPGNATALLAGEKGGSILSYSGYAVWNDLRTTSLPEAGLNQVRMVSGTGIDTRRLDGAIRQMMTAGGKIYAITNTTIYAFDGQVSERQVHNPAYTAGNPNETDPPTITALKWQGEFQPFHQQGNAADNDDYIFLAGFGGRLYTWFGKSVMEHNPGGDRAGWRDTGLGGKRCFGGCVANGWLVVCIEARDARSEIWAYNGAGWWLISSDVIDNNRWCWPLPLYGAANYDVMVFRQGTQNARLIRLVWRDDATRTYPTDGKGEFISSMIDCGERDKAKAWRKAGATFASPEKRGTANSVDPVGVYLDYMADNSGEWIQAAGRTVTGNYNANHTFTLDADIASDAVVSRWLQLRVRWSSVNDWSPVLTGVWAEFEVLDSPARRRRWTFPVVATEQVVTRNGTVLAKSGRELVADLWAAWQEGTTLPFQDIDYDAAPIERRVRIVGIRESVPAPANVGEAAFSTIALTLVEV